VVLASCGGTSCKESSSQYLLTRLTHWAGRMSRAAKAGFGSRYLVSFSVGGALRSAALWSNDAIRPMSYCNRDEQAVYESFIVNECWRNGSTRLAKIILLANLRQYPEV